MFLKKNQELQLPQRIWRQHSPHGEKKNLLVEHQLRSLVASKKTEARPEHLTKIITKL